MHHNSATVSRQVTEFSPKCTEINWQLSTIMFCL